MFICLLTHSSDTYRGGLDTRNWQPGSCPEGAHQLLTEMERQRADYSGQRRLFTQGEWGACRRQGVPGRLPGRGGPELRLEDGLGETRKGVSAEGRACSKSWRQDEPVPLQTVVCVCASLQEGGYMCVHMCVCVHLCGCAHTRVSHKITSGRFTKLAGGS